MDVSSIAAMATNASQMQLGHQVAISVLKMTMDTQQQAAQAMIEAIPAPPNPAHLGNNIDVVA